MPGNLPNAPPPEVIATWPAPNYVDPETRTWLPAFAIVSHIITTALAVLRYLLRSRREGGELGLDDILFLPSWLFSTAFTGLAVYACEHGMMDRHLWDVQPEKWRTVALIAWLEIFTFILGTCCLKLSVLLFFRRLQRGTYNPHWQWALYIAIGFTIAYSLALCLVLIFNCNPTEAYWMVWDASWLDGHAFSCIDTSFLNQMAGVFSILSDAYAVALPCVMMQGLAMGMRQKMGLNAVFAVGVLVVGAGIGRTVEFSRLSRSHDMTWLGFWIIFWSIAEYQLGQLCACLPSLRVFIVRYVWPGAARLKDSLTGRGSAGDDDGIHLETRPKDDADIEHTSRASSSRINSTNISEESLWSALPDAHAKNMRRHI